MYLFRHGSSTRLYSRLACKIDRWTCLVPCTDDVTLVMHFSTRLSQRSRFTLCLRDSIPSSFPLRKLRTRDEASFAKKKKKISRNLLAPQKWRKVEMEICERIFILRRDRSKITLPSPLLRFRRRWAKFISEFKFYPWSKCTLTLRFNRGNPSPSSPTRRSPGENRFNLLHEN